MDKGNIFGRGMAFPPKVGDDGRVAWSSGAQNIEESIRIILLTGFHERVMLPYFGTGLKRFLFEPNTVATHRLIEEAIRNALEQWEPRIEVDNVDIETDEKDPQAALVLIEYTLIANQGTDEVRFRIQLAS